MEYMSQEGFDKIAAELNELTRQRLPEAIKAISEARDKGDLSENFEYHAAKREQGHILSRIRFLQRVLSHARVLKTDTLDAGHVHLLSRVDLLNLDNAQHMTYTIVSPHEARTAEGKISIKSPIARALLNKQKGDTVEVAVPIGTLRLRIENISQ